MTLQEPPSYLQARADHTALQDRLTIGGLVGALGGIGGLSGTGLVTQTGSPSLAVVVNRDHFYIPGAVDQGCYHGYNDGALTVSLGATAGNGTQIRVDLLIAEIEDAFYSGANNDVRFRIVAGTPGAGVPPATPTRSLAIATITMPISASTILNSYIALVGQPATSNGGIQVITNFASISTFFPSPIEGDAARAADTKIIYMYNGTTATWDIIWSPWINYTPTFTNLTAGAGATIIGKYQIIGKTLNFRWGVILGTSPAISGTVSVSIPAGLTAVSDGAEQDVTLYVQAGGNVFMGLAGIPAGGTSFTVLRIPASGGSTILVPIAALGSFAAGSAIICEGFIVIS